MRVVVVGGGVSGLSAAVFLASRGADVTVLEAGRPGGNVRSVREDGYTVDAAANGWLDNEPAMGRLLALVGASGRVVPASDRYKRRWIWSQGRAHLLPGSPPAFLGSPLLSWGAKLRLLGELFTRRANTEDESVEGFANRHLGRQAADRLVAPMVAGVFGGDPRGLSLAAAFPRMAELEREHRSLILAMLRLGRGGAPSGRLCTLDGGAGALPEALAGWLGARVRAARAVGLDRRGEAWTVRTTDGALDTDAVVLATPGYAQAELTRGLDAEAAAALSAVPYAPIAVVALAWEPGAWADPPDGFGVLAARGEDLGVLGVLYSSCIFPAQAPEGHVLARVMIGGAVEPEAAGLDEQALRGRALAALERLHGPPRVAPTKTWVFRYARGIPQYAPGHLGRVRTVRAAEGRLPGLFFTGNHLDGVGIKDCARAGEAAARRVMGA